MDALDHGKVVLAACLNGRRDLLDIALRRLQPAHFTDHVQQALFSLLERYLDQTGGVLPRSALADALRTAAPGKSLLYEEMYDQLSGHAIDDAQFRWSVDQLRELAAERMTGEALAQSMEILTRGAQDGKRELRGHADARDWLLAKLADVDRELHQQDAPEGDVRMEGRAIITEYAQREQHSHSSPGISTGIPELDTALGGGLQPGELDLVGGYTSAGKSAWCSQLAWNATTQQGRNVVIFTTETLRAQLRLKIVSRHSRLEQFGLPDGLNTRDLKAGTLDLAGKQGLRNVVMDFTTNPDYGRCYVAQVPRGGTIGTIESRLSRISRIFPVHLVVIDYLALLRMEGTRRRDQREELSDIVKEAKQLAATFDEGRGVPVVSPWQMNRAGRMQALERGYYTTADLAETSESSSTADIIFALLEPEDIQNPRRVEVKFSVLKNRDGERGRTLTLDVDYATSLFAGRSSASNEGLSGLLGGELGSQFG